MPCHFSLRLHCEEWAMFTALQALFEQRPKKGKSKFALNRSTPALRRASEQRCHQLIFFQFLVYPKIALRGTGEGRLSKQESNSPQVAWFPPYVERSQRTCFSQTQVNRYSPALRRTGEQRSRHFFCQLFKTMPLHSEALYIYASFILGHFQRV